MTTPLIYMIAGTNGSGKTTAAMKLLPDFAEKLRQAKQADYKIGLFFIWLPSTEFAKQRVRLRVVQGGHHIPPQDIERRYDRGMSHLIDIYLPLADETIIVDGTSTLLGETAVIAQKKIRNGKSAGRLNGI